MGERYIYSALTLLLFSLNKSLASPQIGDVRFLFTSGLHFRSDTTFPPKFEYEVAVPRPPAPYIAFYQSTPAPPSPAPPLPAVASLTAVTVPFLEKRGIEQYQGERAYKRQRTLSPQLSVGYGGTTVGRALSYTFGPAVQNGLGTTHTQFFGTSLAGHRNRYHHEVPRYRYTQVGLSYGRRADHHHKDGGYGPYDPHGTQEYEVATGPYRTYRRY